MSISVNALVKTYGSTPIVRDISFTVAKGEMVALLGPSGCGKTTTLRCIAGLETADGGSIAIDGETVSDAARGLHVPVHERAVGMVFQSYAVWPHLSVAGNVGFPLSIRRAPAKEMAERVDWALDIVGMRALKDRQPSQLSGGQQQRVALARALVVRPRCLLLDEPLSNLDTKLRIEMRTEIRRVCKEFGLTAIYVTHDQKEALSIADRLAIMEGGHIRQVGKPAEVYRAPHTKFAADFMGETNFLEGRVVSVSAGRVMVETPLRTFEAMVGGNGWSPKAGEAATLSIRPECWKLGLDRQAVNAISGRLNERVYLGEMAQYRFVNGPHALKIYELNPRFVELSAERELHAAVEPEDVVALPG